MSIKQLTVLFLFICASLGVSAQSENEIKNSGNYYWGEAVGNSDKEALDNATAFLTNSISAYVSSFYQKASFNGLESETSVVESFSVAKLRGLEHRRLSLGDDHKTLAWVSKADVEQMVREREDLVRTYITNGADAERKLQIDDALRCYYWAMMVAKVTPVNIRCNDQDCVAYLTSKINSVLGNLRAQVTDSREEGDELLPTIQFTYANFPVSTLQVSYFNGWEACGPVLVKDGRSEFELKSFPADGKLKMSFEYQFYDQTMGNDDVELIYKGVKNRPKFDAANVELTLKRPKNKKDKSPIATSTAADFAFSADVTADVQNVKAERANVVEKTITRSKASETDAVAMNDKMLLLEQAIKAGKPELAREAFTDEGYDLFQRLLTKTGKVTLTGKKRAYEFEEVEGSDTKIGRNMNIRIKFKNGKVFDEKLVARFGADGKIGSIAMGLTQRAEDDIFNAQRDWPNVSRYAVVKFMEDYQTAFLLKRDDYLNQIFHEKALIIVGTMLKDAPPEETERLNQMTKELNNKLFLGDEKKKDKKVRYQQLSKDEYIRRVTRDFKAKDYIHLTLQDNKTMLINNSHLNKGTMFAIQINQMYNSTDYNDQGYLTLCFDVSRDPGLIYVRLWQPDEIDQVRLRDFIDSIPM